MAVAFVLFIRIRRINSLWKVEKVSYNVDIGSFLRLHSIWGQKLRFHGILDSVQDRISAARSTSKVITPEPLIVFRCASNHWKDEKVFYNYCIGLLVRFQPCRFQI
jgi:hypothetical protein